MIKFKLFFTLFLFAGTVMFISCSKDDNNTNPPVDNNPVNFESLKVGNYWIFENYNIDSLGNKTGSAETDSTYASGTVQKLGKTAYMLLNYSSDGTLKDTVYSYEEGKTYFTHSSLINKKIAGFLDGFPVNPFDLGDIWMKVADYDQSSWDIMSQNLVDYPVYLGATINGTFSLKAAKGTTKTVTINSNALTLQEFILTFNFKGTITMVTGEKQFSVVAHLWFDKKAGLLITTFDNTNFDLGVLGGFPFQGTEKKAIRYKAQ